MAAVRDLAWQESLFDGGPAEPAASFPGLVRTELDDRSWVDHCPGWLRGSDRLFEHLLATGEWRQRERWMYEKKVPEPRLTAGWPVPAPGEDHEDDDRGADLSATPEVLGEMAALLSGRYGVTFDSVWVNLYRDGNDSVAWHGDTNRKRQTNPFVVTVSLGARRQFVMRPRGTTRISHRFEPGPGDLIVMGGACQHDWEHCVPKTRRPVGPRMSVTIRHSKP